VASQRDVGAFLEPGQEDFAPVGLGLSGGGLSADAARWPGGADEAPGRVADANALARRID